MSGYPLELVEQAEALGIRLPDASERKPPKPKPRRTTQGPGERRTSTNWSPDDLQILRALKGRVVVDTSTNWSAAEWRMIEALQSADLEDVGDRLEEVGGLILKLVPQRQLWNETTDGFSHLDTDRKIRWRTPAQSPNERLHDLSVELLVPTSKLRRWRNAALKRRREER